jgi:glycosyltransferase involved in cell wall biosynthesis
MHAPDREDRRGDVRGVAQAVSVIVPTRNRQAFARELVRSIISAETVPAEIVIVDQSDTADPELSADPSERGCAVTYRKSPTRGASTARNEGIIVARGDILVFVDDDVLAAPDWLSTLVAPLEGAGDHTVVTGQVRSGAPESAGGFAPSLNQDEKEAVYEGRAAANVLWTGNMAMFRATVDRIGTFDERLGPGKKRFPGGGEDNDFCFRLLETGHRIVYEPKAVVYHRAWRPPSDYVGVRWRYGRGQGGFYGKHLRLRDPYILRQLTRHVVGCSAAAVREAPRNPRHAVGSAAYAAGIVTAAAEWMLTERLFAVGRRRERS